MLLTAPKITLLKDKRKSTESQIEELKLAIDSEVLARKNLVEKDKQLQTEVVDCYSDGQYACQTK